MASVTIISVTGRLKNKIDFTYSVTSTFPDFITESGMAYTTDPDFLSDIQYLQSGFGAIGRLSTTFTGINNGTYYVKAYAFEDNLGTTLYSDNLMMVFVTDKGYEISPDTINIANPLQIRDAGEGVERVLTSDSSGLATWKPVKSLFSYGHYIGEKYGGGIVAAVWKEGEDEKVLIVSPEDVTSEDGSGVIGNITSIPYKMGTNTTLDNPGTSNASNKYLTYHDLNGSGPYGGGNLQNVAIICIHNLDINLVEQAGFFLSMNGSGGGSGLVPAEVAGAGFFTNIPNGYTYSTAIQKGLLRIKSTTTSVVNVFRVVAVDFYYPAMTTPAQYLAANYRILYSPSQGTMGVFRIYVDYVGSETTPITSGAGQNVPAAQEVVNISFDSTGTGLNYEPLTYMRDFKWAAGAAQTTTVGALAQSLYNGDLNTDAIIAQSDSLNTIYSAAKVCTDYRGSGYDDWYLPAHYELNQVFNNAAIINKVLKSDSLNFLNNNYWTSTEYFFPPGSGGANSTNAALAFNSYTQGTTLGADYITQNKATNARVRAVRKESVYTGDGLIMNLDSTIKKSFSDVDYLNLGIYTKWKDLVNGGLNSSYSFTLSAFPNSVSGGTTTNILADLNTGGNVDSLAYRLVGDWGFTKVTGTTTPTLYNNTGESSLVSNYFTVGSSYTYLQFDTLDQSTIKSTVSATVNVSVSINSGGTLGAYILLAQITNTVGNNNSGTGASVHIQLGQFSGQNISIKITAPSANYVDSVNKSGPSVDNIYVRTNVGGTPPTGPVYLPSESGFIRFNGNSYVDFQTTVGNTTTVTVEAWVRLKPTYSGKMIFGWNQYDVYCASGHLGFNTNSSDLYGISTTQVAKLNLVDNWNHYVFEMKTGAALGTAPNILSNNKIYINGNEQILSQQFPTSTPNATTANFNSGQGRIGGFRASLQYLMPMDMSAFRIYNRPLTKDEIMKNYSTEKKKYEILPKLLENNIFTSIDFDNPNSYSGDGTITGTVTDLSGNSRNATLTISGTTTKPAVQRTNTLYNGKELIFPGTIITNPYLAWPNSVDFQNIQNLSVSLWVKFSVNRSSTIIVRWNNTGAVSGPWEIFQSQSTGTLSTISFRLKTGAVTVERTGTKGIPLNKWTHVCATFDNTTKKMKTYIDSVLDINSSAPSTFTMATGIVGDVIVGRYSTAVNPLQGSLASIQIYNKSLSYGEVRNNYDTDKFRFDNFDDANKYFSHELNGNPTFSISQNLSLEIGNISNEKILKINPEGYSKWTDKNAIFSRPANYRYIGELYGGGIIVAMWYYPKTIFNYLIMSLEDVSASSQYSNVTNVASSATSDFKGEANQTIIIGQSGHTTSATKLCDNYAGGGFTDWYLPSVFEMNQAFNAGSIVDTVLGSDSLAGSYWTSTEINATNAYYYSCSEVASTVGYQKSSSKSLTKKVRAFRLATNAVEVNIWDTTWDEDYTPWWRRRTWGDWEMDWQPATYNVWDFDYGRDWRRTSISIGSRAASIGVTANPLAETIDNQIGMISGGAWDNTLIRERGQIIATFSNTIYTTETILNTGICWATASAPLPGGVLSAPYPPNTPTISNNVAYSTSVGLGNISGTIFPVKTPIIYTSPAAGTKVSSYVVYFRAFVTTPTGTYYSTDTGSLLDYATREYNRGTYSVSSGGIITAYSFPTGCFTYLNGNKSLYE